MRRFLLTVLLLLAFAAPVHAAGGCAGVLVDARNFDFTSSSSVTTSAANITLPSVDGTIFAIQVTAPSTNTDLIYIAAGTATTSSKPVKPAESECVPFKGDSTLSAISASGTQGAQITVFFR